MKRLGLATRLIIASAALAVTLCTALGAFVVIPVNTLVDDLVATHARDRADLAARLVAANQPAPGAVVSAADEVRPPAPVVARRAIASVTLPDGRAVTVTATRSGAIEERERTGLAISLAIVLGATVGWALWAGANHVRRLSRVASTARHIAGGDLTVRTSLDGNDELSSLARDVDHIAVRLQTLEQARSEFIGKVSHDLRTPLTVIRGYAYTLERRAVGDDLRRLQTIGRETDRLAALVDDLLTLAQAGTGTVVLRCEEVAINAVMQEMSDRLRPLAADRSIALEVGRAGGAMVADRARVGQVLTNLLTNAIRHTPVGGVVELAVRERPDEVEFRVSDTGSGIDPASVERLMQPFEQGGSSPGGAGLGLAIVSELVRLQRGTFAIERAPLGGTLARVTLPRQGRPCVAV